MPQVRTARSIAGAAALVIAAASLVACDVAVNTLHGGHARAERVWTRTYTLAGAESNVEIANVNGAITVEAVDGNTLDIKARISVRGATDEAAQEALKQIEMLEQSSERTVRLEAKYPKELGRRGVEVAYTVRAPRTAKLNLVTVNGQVTVAGVLAGVRAETTNGSVVGRGLGNAVVAATTNGEIKIQMAQLGGDGISLETTNGAIELRMPADAKATVSAQCVNGGISISDLAFEKAGEGTRRKIDGRINGGGAAVKLETVNGSIRVGPVS
jgi:DUF4097 and DUF4098 domain-containing protein YvlB